MVLLIIAVGAVIGFKNRNYLISKITPDAQQKKPAEGGKTKVFKAKIPPTVVRKLPEKSRPKRSTRPAVKTAASEQKPKEIKRIKPPDKSGSTAAKTTSPTASAVSSQQTQRSAPVQKPGIKPASSQKFKPSKKSIAGKRTATRKPVGTSRTKPEARTYARLTDAKLQLQALAWSSDASRRMAVINGRIVREGESADGYQINEIRKEDVVVSDGRQTWSLEFGLKQ